VLHNHVNTVILPTGNYVEYLKSDCSLPSLPWEQTLKQSGVLNLEASTSRGGISEVL